MNGAWLRRATVAPVFLLTLAAAALSTGTLSGWVLLGVLVGALPLLALWRRSYVLLLFLPFAAALVGVLFAWGMQGSLGSGAAAELSAGLLIGSPLLFFALFDLLAGGFGLAYLALSEGLAQSLVLVAAATAVGTGAGAGAFVTAYGTTLADQVNGLATIVHGGGVPDLPLSNAGDGVFYALALLAFLGCLLSAFDRSTPDLFPPEAPAPRPPAPSSRRPELDLGLPPPVRDALVDRSPELGEATPLSMAVAPVAVGAAAIVTFLAIAAGAPTWAITALGLGATATFVAVVLLGRAPRPAPIQGGEPGPLARV